MMMLGGAVTVIYPPAPPPPRVIVTCSPDWVYVGPVTVETWFEMLTLTLRLIVVVVTYK
jgi:hypothetical protein